MEVGNRYKISTAGMLRLVSPTPQKKPVVQALNIPVGF